MVNLLTNPRLAASLEVHALVALGGSAPIAATDAYFWQGTAKAFFGGEISMRPLHMTLKIRLLKLALPVLTLNLSPPLAPNYPTYTSLSPRCELLKCREKVAADGSTYEDTCIAVGIHHLVPFRNLRKGLHQSTHYSYHLILDPGFMTSSLGPEDRGSHSTHE